MTRRPVPAPISPAVTARIIHAALVLGIVLFWAVGWYVGSRTETSIEGMPHRRVLYIALFLVSAVAFGAAMYTASRLVPPGTRVTADEWWRANLGRVILVWTLVEAPALLGTIAYVLTRDFRALIAPFTGLLLFVNYRPSRLAER